MTKFTKENLRKESGGYVTYAPHGRLWHKDNKFGFKHKMSVFQPDLSHFGGQNLTPSARAPNLKFREFPPILPK